MKPVHAEEKGNLNKDRLMLAGSMLIFGTIGIFRRYIPLGSAALAMARGFIGMLSLLALMAVRKERISRAAINSNARMLLLSGVLLGLNWILLFEAYNYTSVAVATLCYYMAPIIVMLLSPLLLKERLTARKLICTAAALAGMAFVSGVFGAERTSSDFKGVAFGLSAALFYAGVILCGKKIKNIPVYDKTVCQLGTAAFVLLPYVLISGNVLQGAVTPLGIVMVLAVGFIHTGLAYAMYFGSMGALSAQTVALYGYIDPVVAVVLSALLLSEKLGAAELLGAALILCATAVSELPEKK